MVPQQLNAHPFTFLFFFFLVLSLPFFTFFDFSINFSVEFLQGGFHTQFVRTETEASNASTRLCSAVAYHTIKPWFIQPGGSMNSERKTLGTNLAPRYIVTFAFNP